MIRPDRQRQGMGWVRLTVLGLTVLGLGACSSIDEEGAGYPSQPIFKPQTTRHPIEVIAALAEPSGALERGDRERLAVFMDDFRNLGRGEMVVTVVASDARRRKASLHAVQELAWKRGVEAGSLRVREFDTGSPGIRAAYETVVMTFPECRPEIAFTRSPDNTMSPNFGCAMERSLAAMVVNPADLEDGGGALGPSDGGRHGSIVGLYRQGKATRAESDRNEDAKISKVGK